MSENIEKQAAETLLEEGAKFGIKIFGKERVFAIKPLKLGTIIAISKEASTLKNIAVDDDLIASVLQSAENLRPLSRVIALGILNSRFKNKFAGLLSAILLYSLTTKELSQLAVIVVKQLSVEDFFLTTRLIGGANLLKKISKDTEEGKPSGEPLQE